MDAQQAGYMGASRGTNNTAELTAVAQALKHVIADQSGRPVLIRYDSLYAGNIVTGRLAFPTLDPVAVHLPNCPLARPVQLG